MKLEFGAFQSFFINQLKFKEIYFPSQVKQEGQFNSTLAIKEPCNAVSSRELVLMSSWVAVLCYHKRYLICNQLCSYQLHCTVPIKLIFDLSNTRHLGRYFGLQFNNNSKMLQTLGISAWCYKGKCRLFVWKEV